MTPATAAACGGHGSKNAISAVVPLYRAKEGGWTGASGTDGDVVTRCGQFHIPFAKPATAATSRCLILAIGSPAATAPTDNEIVDKKPFCSSVPLPVLIGVEF
jgi:hypothetical protein